MSPKQLVAELQKPQLSTLVARHPVLLDFYRSHFNPSQTAAIEVQQQVVVLDADLIIQLPSGSRISVNRNELCRVSPVFKAMIEGGFREGTQNQILIQPPDGSERDFLKVMSLVSTRTVADWNTLRGLYPIINQYEIKPLLQRFKELAPHNLPEMMEDLGEFVSFIDRYSLDFLHEPAVQHLLRVKTCITDDNLEGFCKLAGHLNDKNLASKCKAFIKRRIIKEPSLDRVLSLAISARPLRETQFLSDIDHQLATWLNHQGTAALAALWNHAANCASDKLKQTCLDWVRAHPVDAEGCWEVNKMPDEIFQVWKNCQHD